MKKTVIYELEPGDRELIRNPGPKDPCPNCEIGYSCLGCPDGDKRRVFVKKVKDKGLYELWTKYQRLDKIHQLQKELEQEEKELLKDLKPLGLHI